MESALVQEAKELSINIRGMSKTTMKYQIKKKKLGKSPSNKLYNKTGKLGFDGKEGKVYEVIHRNKTYAKKQFKKTKSAKNIEKEVQFQRLASKFGLSPKVKEYNLEDKYIIMEKLEVNLFDILRKKEGKLSKKQQDEIIDIFERLDKHYIFHKDPNPLNFMYDKNKKLNIIDFGFAEMIEEDSKVKNPNMEYMVLGLLIKLQTLFPGIQYNNLYKKLNKEQKEILS